jgi:hypothetical protein
MRHLLFALLAASPLAHAQLAQDTVSNPAPGVPGLPGVSAPEAVTSAPLLYANGTFISQPTGGGPSGTDPVSVLTAPDTTFGSGCTNGSFRLADDFTVPAGGWTIDRIDVFGYQTQTAPGGSTVSPFTTATLRIWSGNPSSGGTIVFGDTTTNRQTATSWTGVWRVLSTALTNQQRPIMRVTMANLGITLPAGTYWVDFAIAPTPVAAVFCPPNTTVAASNNAQQFNVSANTWANVQDTGGARPLDFPFEIYGPPATPPVFGYTPPPGSTVTATGGSGIIGTTSNLSIAVAVQTPGTGTGAPATTTLTCTAPTAPFAGFGQTVTAVGSGAISGGPLAGTCTRGATAVTQTLTCTENQGGTAVTRTWTLNCPAGSPPPVAVNATSVWSLVGLMLALIGFAAVAARRQG